jgi:hypothetical protein
MQHLAGELQRQSGAHSPPGHVHIALINKEFGRKPIRSIKPIHVQTWTAKLRIRLAAS